jgi:hypothetical protein
LLARSLILMLDGFDKKMGNATAAPSGKKKLRDIAEGPILSYDPEKVQASRRQSFLGLTLSD